MNIPHRKNRVKRAFDKGYRMVDGKCIDPRGNHLEGYPRSRWEWQTGTQRETDIIDYVQGIELNSRRKDRCYFKHRDLVALQKFGDKWLFSQTDAYHIDNNSLNNKEDNIDMQS